MAGAAVAWAVLLWEAFAGGLRDHAHTAAGSPALLSAAGSWLLMTAAMMGPVMVPMVRDVARHCSGAPPTLAVAATLAGSLIVWSAVGVVVVGLAAIAPPLDAGGAPVGFGVIWLLVAGWQLTASKASALARCRAIGVPPGKADGRGWLTAGISATGWCVVSCGPAMAAMALTGHPLLLMVVLTVGLTAERVTGQSSEVSRRLAAWTVGAAVAWLVLTSVMA